MKTGPLSGLLVVSIEQAVAAPFCTVKLADAGARVIKIERASGETARNYDATVKGESAYFVWLNRGKESIVLDLKSATDLRLLNDLLGQADVFVQNLAPGALARMGLTEEIIASRFPRLIAASIKGYGQDTDYAAMRAYDLLVQAESGVCSVTGTPEHPCKLGVSAADLTTGMNAHAAILEALIERGITGRGKQIEVAMFDSMAEWLSGPLLQFEHSGRDTARHGMEHAMIYPYGPFDCSDGTVLIATQNNDEWERLCASLDLPDLAARSDFATNALRDANRAGVDQILKPIFARMRLDEAISLLQEAGVAWGRYTEIRDLGQHAALRRVDVALASGALVTVPLPAGRDITAFRAGPVPALGEHTDRVRREFSRELVDD